MKLLSCYIEGYGKIKRREYTFLEGVTSFCEDNGEGKTTLASFIKAMLYGLKGYGKRSVEFCDREHFYPFDGGLFGGNLTVQAGGKTYKIERFFGEKSETADKCKVYCNGEETTELGEDIGKTILGLDRESFERTAFLGSGDIEISSTSNIHAKLNRFLEGGEEQGGLDEALDLLDKAAKSYKKSRAGGDKVTALSAQIDTLRHEVENATAVKRALEGKYAAAKGLQAEIAALNARMVIAGEEREKRSQFEHYESLTASVTKAQNALSAMEGRYPLGMPTQAELDEVNAYMVRANELKIKTEGGSLSQTDRERLLQLEEKFQRGTPSNESLCAVEEDIRLLGEHKGKMAASQSVEGQLRTTREDKKKPATGYALLAVAIVLALAGAALLAMQALWGVALLALGGVGCVVGLLLCKKQRAEEEARSVNEQALRELAKSGRLAREIEDKLSAFFAQYGLTGETPIKLLGELRLLQGEYANLAARQAAATREEAELKAKLRSTQEKLQSFQYKYALKEVHIQNLNEDIRERERLKRTIADGQAQAASYKEKKGLDKYPLQSIEDLSELQFAFSAAQNEKSKLDREIADDERLAERLEEYETDLASAEGLLKEYKRKHGLLTATATLLQRADGRLRDKYVKPVREEFLRYAGVLERTLGEKVVMTKDFQLRFERNGIERSERHFSAGQRSICALCFRLALVKNMYQGETPFLILDDPFTGLDEKHMARVGEVLKALSKDMQMLYFTCHESRKI